jgi:serine/threonine-protein kinase
MGHVWVARNEATGGDVAIKILRRGAEDAEEERQQEERLRQEARLSAMVAHRSVVRVFDLVDEDGTLVLVMELLRGETLRSYVHRRGPRSSLEAVAILSPVLGALAHAHELGLIHRDVSPSNIFLAVDPDGHVQPKLVDFGVAKARTGSTVETVAGEVLGTPRYVAPERIRGARDLDGRADIFSAAVVLYEIISGTSPFEALTPSASLAAVLERTVDPDPAIDPRLWIELRRALSKPPYERHASAREFANALRVAVGASDGEIEASLQSIAREVKPVEESAVVTDEHGVALSSKSRSVPVVPKRSVSPWTISGIVLALLAVGGFAFLRSARPITASAPAASPVPPSTVASPVPVPPPPPVVAPPAPAPSIASAAISASTPSPAASPVPSPAPGPHPKPSHPHPVATTPGF